MKLPSLSSKYRALTSIPFAHPNLKFMEELLGLSCRRFRRLLAHKSFEIRLLTFRLNRVPICEPFVGCREAGPSRDGCCQIDRLPKWVTRRLIELVEFRVERIDELCSPFVSHRALWPVE